MRLDRLAERVAYKLIHDACHLRTGDCILFFGRRDQLDFLLQLEFQALAAGARALISIEDDERLRQILRRATPRGAANERLSILPVARETTHVMSLTGFPPNLSDLSPEAIQSWKEANGALQEALHLHLRAWIGVSLLSRLQTQRLRQPWRPYKEAIWQALDSDYPLMEQRGRQLHMALSDAPLLRLSDPRGAELTLRLAADAPRHRDDGVLSPEDVAEAGGRVSLMLPAGEFRVAVAEGSAEGEAIIDAGWRQGRPLRHLRLRFQQGRVVGIAGAGAPEAEATLATDEGARLLGKLSIGFNPAVTTLNPYPLGPEASLLAYRRAGAVFLTLGDNRAYGGSNRSALEWNLGLARPTLEVAGQTLLRDGAFLDL